MTQTNTLCLTFTERHQHLDAVYLNGNSYLIGVGDEYEYPPRHHRPLAL